ncbi:MAG TPA: cytochrome c [Candidatus Acidoferrales bacterium]|jgi:mono/diheme cytochrome c family protein|nr:cytochrome c [Candidatus Acidoferrales bacterium]
MRTRAPIFATVLILAVGACMAVSTFGAGASRSDARTNLEQGKTLFHAKCGYCHLAGGTGTIMLGFRLGKDKALLENRTDLTTTYIEHVARSGIGSMPRLTRIEVPDSELKLIAAYLTRPASARDAAK